MASGMEKTKDKKKMNANWCSKHFLSKEDLKEHFWSLSHHKKVEGVSKSSLHNCTVCFTSCHSLEDYGKHLESEKHNAAVTKERKAAQERKDNPHQPPPLPPPPLAKSQAAVKTQPLSHKPPPLLPNLHPPATPYWAKNKQRAIKYPSGYDQSWHNSTSSKSTHPATQPWQGAITDLRYSDTCGKSWDNNVQGTQPWEGVSRNAQNEWVSQDFTSDVYDLASGSWQQSFSNGGQVYGNYVSGWHGYSGDWNNYMSGWNWNNWDVNTHNNSRGGRGGRSVHKTPNNNKPFHKGKGSSDKGKCNPQNKGWPKSAKSAKSKKKAKAMAKKMSIKMSSKKKHKTKTVSCKKWLGSQKSPIQGMKISSKNIGSNHTVTFERSCVKRTVSLESLRHSGSWNQSRSTSATPVESSGPTSVSRSKSATPVESSGPTSVSRSTSATPVDSSGPTSVSRSKSATPVDSSGPTSVSRSTRGTPVESSGPTSASRSTSATPVESSGRTSVSRSTSATPVESSGPTSASRSTSATPVKSSGLTSVSRSTRGTPVESSGPTSVSRSTSATPVDSSGPTSESRSTSATPAECSGPTSVSRSTSATPVESSGPTSVSRSTSATPVESSGPTSESRSTSAAPAECSGQTSEKDSRKTDEHISKPAALTSSNKPVAAKLPKLNGDMVKKDSFVQMVKSPRSWRDRHKLAEMMRKHVKTVPKRHVSISNLHLSEMFADLPEPTGEVHLENLPSQLQVKIADLIEPSQVTESCSKDVASSSAGLDESAKSLLSNDSDLDSVLKAIKTEPGLNSVDTHLPVGSGLSRKTSLQSTVTETSKTSQSNFLSSKRSSLEPRSCNVPASVRSEPIPDSKLSGHFPYSTTGKPKTCTTSLSCPVTGGLVQHVSLNQKTSGVAKNTTIYMTPSVIRSSLADVLKSTAPSPVNSSKSNMFSTLPSPSLVTPVVSSHILPVPAQTTTTTLPSGSVSSSRQPVSSTITVSGACLGTNRITNCTVSESQPVSSASSFTANVTSTVTAASGTNSSLVSATLALPKLSSPQTNGRVRKKSPADPGKRKQTSHHNSRSLTEHEEEASVKNSCTSETLSYVNRVLELSMKEEALREDIQEVNSQMDMVHRLLLNYQLQFTTLDRRRNQLLKEEESLRAERMKILQEAVWEAGPSRSSREVPKRTSEVGTEDIAGSAQVSRNHRQVNGGQESHGEGRISCADLWERRASHDENSRLQSETCASPAERVTSTLTYSVVPNHSSGNSLTQESRIGNVTSSSGTTCMKTSAERANESVRQQPNPEWHSVSSGLPGVVVKVEPLSDTEDVAEEAFPLTNGTVSCKRTLSSPSPLGNPNHLSILKPLNNPDSEPQTGVVFNKNPVLRETYGNNGIEKNGEGNHSDPEVGMLPSNNTVLSDSDTRKVESMVTSSVARELSRDRTIIGFHCGHLGENKASVESPGSQLAPNFPAITASLRMVDDASNGTSFLAEQSIGSESVLKKPRKSQKISVPKTKKKPQRKKGASKMAKASDNRILQEKLGLVNTQLPDFCMQYMGTLKEGDDKSTIISKLASNLIASQLSAVQSEPWEVPLPEPSCSSGATEPVTKPSDHSTTYQHDDHQAKELFFSRLKETFDQSMTGPADNDVESLLDKPRTNLPDTKVPDGITVQQKFGAKVGSQHQTGITVAEHSAHKDFSLALMSPPAHTKTKKGDRIRKKRVQLLRNHTIDDCSSDSTTQDEETNTCRRRTKRRRLAHKKTFASVSASRPDNYVVLSSTDTENVSERESKVKASDVNSNDESFNETEKADVDMSQLKCKKFTGPDCNVTCVKVHQNQLYVCYNGYCARKFDLSLEGSGCVQEYSTGDVPIMCMAVTNKGHSTKMTRVFLAGDGQVLFIFNAKTGDQIDKQNFGDKIRCLHCRWGHMFMGLNNGAVMIYDLKENKSLGAYRCASKAITCVTSATEGVRKIICVASLDASIGVFDASSGVMLRTLGGHTGVPNALQTWNHQLFSVSGDGRTLVHDICTGALDQILTRAGSYLSAVLPIDVDNELFVLTAGYDKFIRSYNFGRQKVEQMYYGAGYGVLTCMIMYNGMLFTGNRDGLVEVLPYNPQVCCPCEAEKCKFVFGLFEHKFYHMRVDHHLVSCSWKSCGQLLSTADEKAIDDHMTRHLLKS
ncbi:mucin-5AC-like [Liolophura sinensis]|uniref:mucin-5AC-like n=1 Tax=Liolophura sinensis TaxID=3198878 RepID=UPI003158431C